MEDIGGIVYFSVSYNVTPPHPSMNTMVLAAVSLLLLYLGYRYYSPVLAS
jgi:hypothetical protein